MGYEELIRRKPPREKPGILVSGSFQCQFCNSVAFEAQYNPQRSTLRWECPECEQTSQIERFSLQ